MPATATSTACCSARTRRLRKKLLTEIFAIGMELGGAISGEHGLGRAKTELLPANSKTRPRSRFMRRIKESFDPAGILNPGVLFVDA